MHILLVENDPHQLMATEKALEYLQLRISKVNDGEKAIDFLRTSIPDLVIMDWWIPKISCLDVLRWIRAQLGSRIAILLLTDKLPEADIVFALNAGADEYMPKPVSPAELAARVNALLRRAAIAAKPGGELHVGAYVLDPYRRTVFMHDMPVDMTSKEFHLAMLLFNNLGATISRTLMTKTVWGRELHLPSRTLDTHIYQVRRKLLLTPENGFHLCGVYSHGYRLDTVPTDPDPGNSPSADSSGHCNTLLMFEDGRVQ